MLTFDDFLKGISANGASVYINWEQFCLSYFLTTSSLLITFIDSLLVKSSSGARRDLISGSRFVYSLNREDKSGIASDLGDSYWGVYGRVGIWDHDVSDGLFILNRELSPRGLVRLNFDSTSFFSCVSYGSISYRSSSVSSDYRWAKSEPELLW